MTAEIVADDMFKGYPFQVCCTHLSNGYIVSTVEINPLAKMLDSFLNIGMALTGTTLEDMAEMTEHGFRADLSTPGDFETMVFPCNENGEPNSSAEVGFQRYMSREEAEQGHKEMVEKWLLRSEIESES